MEVRPSFVNNLAQLHYSRLIRCLVLTGNIHDLFVFGEGGKVDFYPLETVLNKSLESADYPRQAKPEQFVMMVLKSDGIHFGSAENEEKLAAFKASASFKALSKKPSSPQEIIRAIGDFLREVAKTRDNLEKEKSEKYVPPICIIVDQAETIFPNVAISQMSMPDREIWRYFCDFLRDETIWADSGTADQRPDFLILLSPTAAEVNKSIFTLPKVEALEIPLPDRDLIKAFVAKRLTERPIPDLYHGKPEAIELLAADARGLSLRVIDDLVTAAQRDPEGSRLSPKTVIGEVDKRLEISLGKTIKLIRPSQTVADVVGFRDLKSRLAYLVHRVNDPKRAPAGMTVVGPNGAGKTFIIEAWAAGMGRTVLSLAGGMKSKWYGETETFLENFESLVSVYGRVCILVDEAHKAFGSIHRAETYETEAHYARHIIQMISNPKYLSKIFWVLITTRPDLLDPDFVRPGRCSLFVPICDPEGEDAQDFLSWMLRNFKAEGIELSAEEEKLLKDKASKPGQEFSAGDYRKFLNDLIDARGYALEVLKKEFSATEFIEGWKPSSVRIGRQRKQQLLLAALNCGEWPELLPKRYREMTEEQIHRELRTLEVGID